jgi:hypothetical protein
MIANKTANSSNNGTIPSMPPGVKFTTLENRLTIIISEAHSETVV